MRRPNYTRLLRERDAEIAALRETIDGLRRQLRSAYASYQDNLGSLEKARRYAREMEQMMIEGDRLRAKTQDEQVRRHLEALGWGGAATLREAIEASRATAAAANAYLEELESLRTKMARLSKQTEVEE
jgi:hypothetical protein